jgi:mRNA-degrading endonuclease RelE of RelBE toxin-antitoxin system
VRLTFIWSETARLDLRKIEKEQAMRILRALAKYGATREGDVKALHGRLASHLRLRVGNWRVEFKPVGDAIHIIQIENRGQAY